MTTNFEDLTLPKGQWTNLHAALGLSAGVELFYQNTASVALRVASSELAPTVTKTGIVVRGDGVTYKGTPDPAESIWVRPQSVVRSGQIGVQTSPPNAPMAVSDSVPKDFEIELAADRIPGKSRVLKFGERIALPGTAGIFATIWDGVPDIYVPPTQARIHDVASTSAQDAGALISGGTVTLGSLTLLVDSGADFIGDGVQVGDAVVNDTKCTIAIAGVLAVQDANTLFVFRMAFPETGTANGPNDIGDAYRVVRPTGTGAALSYIQGLDALRFEQNEFVINNGLVNVPSLLAYIRQSRMRIFAAGASNEAVGSITSTAQVDGTVSATVNNGTNQSLMAVFTVPANKRGFLKRWRGALVRKQAASSAVRLRVGLLDGVGYVSRTEGLVTAGASTFERELGGFAVPPRSDVWVEADSDSPSVGVAAGFDIVLEDAE